MQKYSKAIKGILAVPPAAISGLLLALLPGAMWEAETASLIGSMALFQTVASITAFNSNYVFMTRYAQLSPCERRREFTAIMAYRAIIAVLTLFAVTFLSTAKGQSLALTALYLISKLLQETQLNKLRAASKQDVLLIWCWLFYGIESLIILYSYFYGSTFNNFLTSLSLLSSFLVCLWFLIFRKYIVFRGLSQFPLKSYLLRGMPLFLSSVREGLMGPGLIAAAAQIMSNQSFLSFNLLVRVLRVGSVIFSSLSNFYFQDLSRGIAQKSSLFVVFGLVTVFYISLIPASFLLAKYYTTPMVSFADAPILLITCLTFSVYMSAYYSIVQYKWMITSNLTQVVVFELLSIATISVSLYFATFSMVFLWFAFPLGYVVPGILMLILLRFNLIHHTK